MLDSAGQTSTQGSTVAPEARRSLCEFGLEDSERRGVVMEFRTCRAASSSSATNIGALTSAVEEFHRQLPDSPTPCGDVRRKVFLQEDGEGVGDGLKADGGGRKKGVLDGGFLGRKRAPPVPHLSSGSEGGSSDSSSNASPSPTKLMSTSPRQRKLAPELPSQDSSL